MEWFKSGKRMGLKRRCKDLRSSYRHGQTDGRMKVVNKKRSRKDISTNVLFSSRQIRSHGLGKAHKDIVGSST